MSGFLQFDLGSCRRGQIVDVTLRGNQANIRLMPASQFASYRAGRRHTFYGGRATRSPVRLTVPHDGQWVVIVDMEGLAGTVNAAVRVRPGALPPLRPVENAAALAEDGFGPVPDGGGPERTYDVFVSHATEDKDDVVRPLAHALTGLGLAVWYDEFELRVGDGLRRSIDKGLVQSRFGIIVLSEAFFAKNWPRYELDGLVAREMQGTKVILPVWHRLTRDVLLRYSPSLADKVALSTGDYTVAEIAEQIAIVVRGHVQAA